MKNPSRIIKSLVTMVIIAVTVGFFVYRSSATAQLEIMKFKKSAVSGIFLKVESKGRGYCTFIYIDKLNVDGNRYSMDDYSIDYDTASLYIQSFIVDQHISEGDSIAKQANSNTIYFYRSDSTGYKLTGEVDYL